MNIEDLKLDSAAIESGQWVDSIPGMGDLRLKVRGLTAPSVRDLRIKLDRNVPRHDRARDGSLTPERSTQLFSQVLHEAVLLDWDGLTAGGLPLPYDAEKAKVWLSDPDFAHFADAVVWAAQLVDKTPG